MGNEQSGGGDGDGGGDGGSGSMNANAHGLPPLKELRAILGSEDVPGASNLEEIHGTLELKKYETAPMNKASLDFADDIYSQLDPYRKTEKHDILKRLYVAAVKNGDGMVSHGDAAFAALACCTSATSAHATGECLFHIIDVSVCSARALSLSLLAAYLRREALARSQRLRTLILHVNLGRERHRRQARVDQGDRAAVDRAGHHAAVGSPACMHMINII